ncbi:MAG: hypothetical protein WC872_00720 [Candidatus Absconditabacterales bacterium]
MSENEIQQIMNVIKNIEEKKGHIAYLSELENHEIYGQFFKGLDENRKNEIRNLINDYLKEKISELGKTKGSQLFKRFFEVYEDLFWEFRELNEYGGELKNEANEKLKNEIGGDKKSGGERKKRFQEVGKKVEHEIFKLEGILTEKMLDQEKGLDKVIGAFYNIVYCFFPRYNEIE